MPRKRFDTKVEAAIRRLVADKERITPAEVERELDLSPGLEGLDKPERRSIARRLRALRPDDKSEPWDLSQVEVDLPTLSPQDLAFLIRTLRVAYQQRQVPRLTKREAEWIVRVGRARPDISEMLAYRFAHRYMAAQDAKQPTTPLDRQLAVINPQMGDLLPDEQLDERLSRMEDSDGKA